ncbi:MAG: iron ABC transporter substrate-binding protein [Pseudomonadota bacterium]
MNRTLATRLLTLALALLAPLPSTAAITLTDIAGRRVTLEQPAKRLVLGEGRFVSVLGVLGLEHPIDYVAGMMNEFRVYDPTSFKRYTEAFPSIDDVPSFGNTSEATVSVEKLLSLLPDLAIFGLSGHGPGTQSRHVIDRLEAAGIPVLFIDFRQDPVANTAPSVMLVANALGLDDRGRAYSDYYTQQLARVTDGVGDLSPDAQPRVLFDLRASASTPCCLTVAKGMFADLAQLAGARSMATDILPGPTGMIGLETALTADFDFYVGTAIGSGANQRGRYEHLAAGPGISDEQATASLRAVLEERGMSELPAVQRGRAALLWHHFYNSPLNLFAIQAMAKWFHPQRFADLRPEDTLAQLLAGFAPVDLEGTYAISLLEESP